GVRARLHGVWIVARLSGASAVDQLLALAKNDSEPRVEAQALRAIGDLTDPVLMIRRVDAGLGGGELAKRLAALGAGRDPRVQLEVVIALGRLRWIDAPAWLRANIARPDAALAHAMQWTLRRSGNWSAVLKLLDEPDASPIPGIANP